MASVIIFLKIIKSISDLQPGYFIVEISFRLKIFSRMRTRYSFVIFATGVFAVGFSG